MAENTERKKYQQNLLNYISHNLNTKVEKEKEKEKCEVKGDGKSSSDTNSANSGPKQQRQQRPKPGTQGLSNQSATSSTNRQQPTHRLLPPNNKQAVRTKGNTLNTSQTPKTRTPPSLECTKPPRKKLNLKESAMEVEDEAEQEDIPGSNTHGDNIMDATRHDISGCESAATRSNLEIQENTTRRNPTVIKTNTSSNELINDDTISSNNDAKVKNPYELEMNGDDDEMLDDLGPELAKMGRILAREITKSLSKALIPLQREINDLKETQSSTLPINDVQDIIEENDRLKTKVDQLKTYNIKLKNKLNHIEDKLLENNLLFFGISEKEGETEYDRYSVILDIISTTFIGPDYETQVQQARQIQIEKLVRKGRYSQNKIRQISVTFTHQWDLQELLTNRKYLPSGIAISREFGEHTENERKFLKPIPRAANTKNGYRKKCQLEGDHLVIKGKHYNRENIEELPEDCCDMGQNDTIGKIELNSSFVLSSKETNCKNDIQ